MAQALSSMEAPRWERAHPDSAQSSGPWAHAAEGAISPHRDACVETLRDLAGRRGRERLSVLCSVNAEVEKLKSCPKKCMKFKKTKQKKNEITVPVASSRSGVFLLENPDFIFHIKIYRTKG